MKQFITLLTLTFLFFFSTIHAQLTVKDQDTNPLLQVHDEGSAGSIWLGPISEFLDDSKLYNKDGNLYWGANQMGLAGSAGGWTDDGIAVRLSTNTDKVGIGTTSPLSLLSVGGDGVTNATISSITNVTNGRGIYGKASNTGDVTNYGGYFEAFGNSGNGVFGITSGSEGRGIYGVATYSGSSVNYGGYFESYGVSGSGVYGFAQGTSGKGISGKALGTSGIGVYGYAENSGDVTNYGGYFATNGNSGSGVFGITSGSEGRGIYGVANYSGNSINYGGLFESWGNQGRGVYGSAENSGDVTNYGGYFKARGLTGYGIWAEATSSSGTNYGGHFSTASESGRAIRGHATNTTGENYGGAFRADGDESRGVWAYGNSYDYYAAGPGVNYGDPSSIRWKKNIIEINDPLEKLMKIRGVYFDWDPAHGGEHDLGCIAEEVGKVLPEIVVYEENGIDADGMDYGKLTPLLIEAVKEQQKIIEKLTMRIEELEKR
jgi:hypothetical protein